MKCIYTTFSRNYFDLFSKTEDIDKKSEEFQSKYNNNRATDGGRIIPNCSLSEHVLAEIRSQCIKLRKVRKIKQKKMTKKMKGMWSKMKPSSPWSMMKNINRAKDYEKNEYNTIQKKSSDESKLGRMKRKDAKRDKTQVGGNPERFTQKRDEGDTDIINLCKTDNKSKTADMIPKSALSANVLTDIRSPKKTTLKHPRKAKKNKFNGKTSIERFQRQDPETKSLTKKRPPIPPQTPKITTSNVLEKKEAKVQRTISTNNSPSGYSKVFEGERTRSCHDTLKPPRMRIEAQASNKDEKEGAITPLNRNVNERRIKGTRKDIHSSMDTDKTLFLQKKNAFEMSSKTQINSTNDGKGLVKTVHNLKRPRPRPRPRPPPPRQMRRNEIYTNPSLSNEVKMARFQTLPESDMNKKHRELPNTYKTSNTSEVMRKDYGASRDNDSGSKQAHPKQFECINKGRGQSSDSEVLIPNDKNIHKSALSSEVLLDIRTSSNELRSFKKQEVDHDIVGSMFETKAPPSSINNNVQDTPVQDKRSMKDPSSCDSIQKSALPSLVLSDICAGTTLLRSPEQQKNNGGTENSQSLLASIKRGDFQLKKPNHTSKASPEKVTILSQIKEGKALRRLSKRLLKVKEKTKSE